ncbi:zinc-binding dehydrogenase, partial [Kingella oralis]
LFDRLDVNKPVAGGSRALLLVGGAGGVGSITVQLLKTLTDIQIIATASRPESEAWLRRLGADDVINHRHSLPEQVVELCIDAPSWVFSTNHSAYYLPQLAELLAPQGRIALIDDPEVLDANPLKGKSISLHWEFMFTRALRETADIARQGEILAKVAQLVDEGRLHSTATQTIDGINAANLRRAHQMVERGDMVGKVVLAGW